MLDGRAVHTTYFLATSIHSEGVVAADFACFGREALATQVNQTVSLHAARADEINYTAPLWPCSPQRWDRTKRTKKASVKRISPQEDRCGTKEKMGCD